MARFSGMLPWYGLIVRKVFYCSEAGMSRKTAIMLTNKEGKIKKRILL